MLFLRCDRNIDFDAPTGKGAAAGPSGVNGKGGKKASNTANLADIAMDDHSFAFDDFGAGRNAAFDYGPDGALEDFDYDLDLGFGDEEEVTDSKKGKKRAHGDGEDDGSEFSVEAGRDAIRSEDRASARGDSMEPDFGTFDKDGDALMGEGGQIDMGGAGEFFFDQDFGGGGDEREQEGYNRDESELNFSHYGFIS